MSTLVFRTNIIDARHVKAVSPHIKSIGGIRQWNIDLQDADKVLRVVTDELAPSYIELVVQRAGYCCTELE